VACEPIKAEHTNIVETIAFHAYVVNAKIL